MIDPTDIRAQEAEEAKAMEAAKRNADIFSADLTWVMSDTRGRRFIRRLIDVAGVYRISYQAGDSHATAFNEGSRLIGNSVVAMLNEHCPALYGEMINESKSNDR